LPAYIPDAHNVPLLGSHGQSHFNAYWDAPGFSGGARFASTFAGSLAIFGAAAYAQQDNRHSCNIHVRRHLELGAGISESTPSGTQAGYGEAFLQGNYGSRGKRHDWAWSVRTSAVRYQDFRVFDEEGGIAPGWKMDWGILASPGFTYRYGFPQAKLEIQALVSLSLVQAAGLDRSRLAASLGMGLSFGD
jgi:hypothetical protein